MEKQRGIKVLSVIALVVAVLGLTVAFAALSTTLTINGQATVSAGTWDIKFENLSEEGVTTGEASVNTEPTINANGTEISKYDIVLTKPGDSVSYTFDVHNNGSIDAKIGTLKMDKPTCESMALPTPIAEDATMVCEHLTYELTYADSNSEKKVSANDEINSSESKKMKLTIGYAGDADQVPSDDVHIKIPELSMIYVQK